jgi:predicted DNA-binding transcriptional regulator YafY
MSKRETLMRQNAIINKIKKGPSTLKEIDAELALQSDLHGYNLKISKKTFKRDLDDILSLYQIHIEYNATIKKYEILNQEDENLSDRILDAFDTLNALNSSVGFSTYLDLEKRKSAGNQHFYGILHAIKNRQLLEITYQSYWDTKSSVKNLEPYLLKEFKNRWYIIAKDTLKNELRTYGLDRILGIHISKKKFHYPASFIAKNHFKDSFGIIRKDSDKPVQNVVLSFNHYQGKYIKSLPLHSSQEILTDNQEQFIIKLHIYVTFDFEMELLSYGPTVEVIEPAFLRQSIKEKLEAAISLYNK